MLRLSSYTISFEYAPVEAAILMHGCTGALDLVPVTTTGLLKNHSQSRGKLSYKAWLTIRERGYLTAATKQQEVKRMFEMLSALKSKLLPRINIKIESFGESTEGLRSLLSILADLATPATMGDLFLDLNNFRFREMISILDVAPHWPAAASLLTENAGRMAEVPAGKFGMIEAATLVETATDIGAHVTQLKSLLDRGAKVLWIIELPSRFGPESGAQAIGEGRLLKQKYGRQMDFLLARQDQAARNVDDAIVIGERYYAVMPFSDLPLYRRMRNFLQDPSMVLNASPFFRDDVNVRVVDGMVLAGSSRRAEQQIGLLHNDGCDFDFKIFEELISPLEAPEITRERASCPFALLCGCTGANGESAEMATCSNLKPKLQRILPSFFYA